MKLLLAAVLIAALQSDTTALVDASKDAKTKRKTSTTKVITNADVKKSKGKLIEKPGTATTTAEAKPEPTETEKQNAMRTARLTSETRLAAAQKAVADLEREIAAIEASYFEANDLDHRDKVIAKRFEETKKKLDAARKELAAAQGGSSVPRSLGGTGGPEDPRN